MILAGDIGGTKTLLALFERAAGPAAPVEIASVPTRADTPPAEMVEAFLAGRAVERAALGVAGAVIDGRAQGSNLPWVVRQEDLAAATGSPTRLLNDLHALACWVPHLQAGAVVPLQAVDADPRGAIGVIAPGTGLGQAMLFHQGGRHHPVPSEAGHIDFSPGNRREARWWHHLHERFGHVSLERACSGGTLPLLVEFLRRELDLPLDEACAAAMDAGEDATPTIVSAGLEQRCALCGEALQMFADMLAGAAGNLALQVMATGGIFLGGGLSPRLMPLLDCDRWRTRFRDKGRFAGLMESIPAAVIADDRAGLFGAAACALGPPGPDGV